LGKTVKPYSVLKIFAISSGLLQAERMTQPLALVCYEKLLPGSQVVNRLQDLTYRVQTVADPSLLPQCAEQAKPMLVLADLESRGNDVCAAITRLRQNPTTGHLPVIAFGGETVAGLHAAAQTAGATLIVSATALLTQLPELLDQALQVE
jgi:CheY-like chemotaxis protein